MSEDYPEPPTTAEAEFPLLSEAEDPEEYRDKWGQVIDDMVSRRLEEYLTGNREIPAAMVDELESTTHSTEDLRGTIDAAAFGNDGQAIQDAIDEAVSKWGDDFKRVVVPGMGETWITSQQIDVPSYTVVEINAHVQLSDGEIDGDGTDDGGIIKNDDPQNGNEHIVIRGDGMLDGTPTDDWRHSCVLFRNVSHGAVKGIEVTGAARAGDGSNQGEGVSFWESDNCRVSGVTAHHNDYDGIKIRESEDCRAINNTVYNNGRGGSIQDAWSTRSTIVGNTIWTDDRKADYGRTVKESNSGGLVVHGATNMTATGNTIEEVTFGVWMHDMAQFNTVSDNTFEAVDNVFYLHSHGDNQAFDNQFSDNIAEDIDDHAVRLASGAGSVSISGNELFNVSGFGITYTAGNEPKPIRDNIIETDDGNAAIRVTTTVDDSMPIVGNTCHNVGSDSPSPILPKSDNLQIKDNEFIGYGSFDVEGDGIILTQNTFEIGSGNIVLKGDRCHYKDNRGTVDIMTASGTTNPEDVRIEIDNDHIDRLREDDIWIDDGVRGTINGVGDNGTDDPRSAGRWNANGFEGVVVKWDDSGTNRYEKFIDGSWVEIGSV